jgi:CubicO group peptidase (beta-lactamase class C family)
MLAKQGKLSLDDDVRRWIPEVPNFGKTITVRHLIHHTSGLRDYFGLVGMTDWPSDGPLTEARFLDLVSRQKSLNFDPGERSLYSNTGYVLLSILVKRVSGTSLREFADAFIFAPLGMTNSHFRDDHRALVKHRALAYAPRDGKPGEWQIDLPGFDVVGDGGLFTTVDDLAKWARNSDDHTVGGDDIAALVLTRGRLNLGDTIPYAFGLQHGTYRGLATIDHSGSFGGYRTDVLRFPAQHLAVLTLCNAGNANAVGLGQQVAAVYLGDRLAPVATASQAGSAPGTTAVTVSRDRLERYAGAYWDAKNEALLRLEIRNDALAVVGSRAVLTAVDQDRFRAPAGGPTLAFVNESNGPPRMDVVSPTNERTPYSRMPAPRTDAGTIAAYVGDYYSDELDVTWSIVVDKGTVIIRRRAVPDWPVQPAFLDAFVTPRGVLRFGRDDRGRVTGFVIGGGRVTGFKFTRLPP